MKLPCSLCSLLLVIIISQYAVSQQKLEGKKDLVWEKPYFEKVNGQQHFLMYFDGASYPDSSRLPWFSTIVSGEIKEAHLTSLTYETIQESNVFLLPFVSVADSFLVHLSPSIKYKKPATVISVLPIRFNKESKLYERLRSFSYSYTLSTKKTSLQSFRASDSRTTTSALSSGDWYKLEISSSKEDIGSGIYKIDYKLLSEILGESKVRTLDPRNLRLLGNGGGMLPEKNAVPRPDDLIENAIWIAGEEDGKFNSEDYILFYGKGPDVFNYDPSSKTFDHTKNLYCDHAYYFLTLSEAKGKRVSRGEVPAGAPVGEIRQYQEHLFHELDANNLIASGKDWYGEAFNTNTPQNFNFKLKGLVAGTPVTLYTALMASSSFSSKFNLLYNNQSLNPINIGANVLSQNYYGPIGVNTAQSYTLTDISSEDLALSLSFTKSGSDGKAIGYLNYFEINYQKTLALYDNETLFQLLSDSSKPVSKIVVGNSKEDMKIWEVTPLAEIKELPLTFEAGSSTAVVSSESYREYVAFQGSSFPAPKVVGRIENQNLHGIASSGVPDMIIVTSEDLKPVAQELADFRKSNDKLEVVVATTSQIYNEFSSGSQDIGAIRDFVKMVYDRGSSSDSLRYLLLFGGASYDYKDRLENNTNVVPIFQTEESLDNVRSQSSDDFYGYLDNNEGDMENLSGRNLDIGIGRIPVNNKTEALEVVKKLKNYSLSKEALGKWRNVVCFVADNKDYKSSIHMDDAQKLEPIIKSYTSNINLNKLYMDAYPLVSTAAGANSPAIKDALLKQISSGALIINYSGHGGASLWAQENIFQDVDIDQLNNKYRLPFFVTATCEFGVYDNPKIVSGAQKLILNNHGGGIGILSSTRPVYQSSNLILNSAFYNSIFNFSSGIKPRMGDVMRETKNNSISGTQNLNYALLCDPSLMLAYPEQKIVITAINDSLVGAGKDTLKSLSSIKMYGEVQNNGALNSSYNGTANITVFDKENTYQLNFPDDNTSTSFNLQNNIIYEGTAIVKQGKFNFSFTAPKDISYNYGVGKISLYSTDSSLHDATGSFKDLIIGGVNPASATEDITPPVITLFINDETFQNGGLTGPNPKLIIHLKDESGINISSSGVGHEITAILNSSKETFVLNNFYNSVPGQANAGIVNYPLYNLPPGHYTVKVKAWDIYNNSAVSSIDFVVSGTPALEVSSAGNYPNPFSLTTQFSFDHNKAGQDLEVELEIFSLSGVLVKDYATTVAASTARVSLLEWPGKDDSGTALPAGLYIYKLLVKEATSQSQVTIHKKLIIAK